MKKYSPFLILLFLFIVSCGCVKKPGPAFSVNEKWKVWLPDSAATYNMKSSNGLIESYKGGTKPTVSKGSYSNQVSFFVCEHGDTEFTYITHSSSLNNYELQIRISANPKYHELSISFQDLYIAWELEKDINIPVTTQTRKMEASKTELDSLMVGNTLYRKIWKFTVTNPASLGEHEAQTLYLTQHFGVIRYEEAGGVIWERE